MTLSAHNYRYLYMHMRVCVYVCVCVGVCKSMEVQCARKGICFCIYGFMHALCSMVVNKLLAT